MWTIFGIIGLVAIIFVIHLVNAAVVQNVRRLQDIDECLEQVSSISDVEFTHAATEVSRWAETNGFEPEGYFLLHSMDSGVPAKCASWWSHEYRVFLMFYYIVEKDIRKTAIDFYTPFTDNYSLTTASTIDGHLMPTTRINLVQSITNVSYTQQFERHMKSVKNIGNKHAVKLVAHKPQLFQTLKEALKAQADYTASLPLWRYRGAYWYFVRRHLLSLRRYS